MAVIKILKKEDETTPSLDEWLEQKSEEDKLKHNTKTIVIYSTSDLWDQCEGGINIKTPFNNRKTSYIISKEILDEKIIDLESNIIPNIKGRILLGREYLENLTKKLYTIDNEVYNLNVEICRFYNVYGPYEIINGDSAAVIGIWRRQVRDGEKITIVGDGEQRRSFMWIDDCIDAIIGCNHSQLGRKNNYN